MPKVAPSHLEARRRGILGAAARCFARQGVQRTTMRDICRAANLSAGAVYRYFGGKEEILEALARQRQRQISDFFAQLEPGSGKDRGAAALATLLAKLDDPGAQEGLRLDVVLWGQALHHEPVRRAVVKSIAQMIAERGSELGAASGLHPESAARLLLAILQGLALQKALDPSTDLTAIAGALRGTSG